MQPNLIITDLSDKTALLDNKKKSKEDNGGKVENANYQFSPISFIHVLLKANPFSEYC